MLYDYDKAHNTYLELASEYGIPTAVALVAAVTWVTIRCFQGSRERHRDQELSVVGFCASVVVGVHSLFDFSVEIPAVAATYAALLRVAWSQSFSSRAKRVH
jgi:O-antigen ligase